MARRRRRGRGGRGGVEAYDEPIGPPTEGVPIDTRIGPLPAAGRVEVDPDGVLRVSPFRGDTPEELKALEEALKQRPRSAGFSERARPARGKYFNKLSGRLKMAKRRGGRLGQAIELGTSLGSRVISGRGLGLGAGRVGALRSLAGLGGLGALAYLAAEPAYEYLTKETDVFGPGLRTREQARMNAEDVLRRQNDLFRGKQIASIMENARMQQSIQDNLQRVAQNNPALYNQVSAGRRLPRGAVVLGGQPRQDLLMELARAMDSGAFQQPDPLSDLIG